MKPGDLIFIRGTEGIAGPIKKITRSPYTHIAGIVLNNKLIESQGMRKTGYEDLGTYRGVADVYTCNSLTDQQRNEVVRLVKQKIGTKYDYMLIGWLACRHLIGNIIPLVANNKRGICTTLWADAYKTAGIDLCPDIQYPTPGELSKSTLLECVGSF